MSKKKKNLNKKRKRKQKSLGQLDEFDKKINKKNFLGAVLDRKNGQFRVYTNDILIKRVKRESERVGKSFDKLCFDKMEELSHLYSNCVYHMADGFMCAVDKKNEIAIDCGRLLFNAAKTIEASFELIRSGYILQPGMLLRSVVEVFSLISYIQIDEQAYTKFKEGKVDINKTIKFGKQLIPPLGRFQGLLSSKFVHISELHSDFNIVTEYKEMIEPLELNLAMIKVGIFITSIITELVFYDYFDSHEFWEKINKREFKLNTGDNASEWFEDIFKEETK